jgi:hypothetical protein
MDRTRILERVLELKFKGKNLSDNAKQDDVVRYWKTSRGKERAGIKSKRKDRG